MRYKNLAHVAMLVFGLIALPLALQPLRAQKSTPAAPVIPKTWDDEAIATLEVPLADPVARPNTFPLSITIASQWRQSTRAIPFMYRAMNLRATCIG